MSATQTETGLDRGPSVSRSVRDQAKIPFQAHEAINLGRISSAASRHHEDEHFNNDLPPPSTAVEALERWNYPPRNKYALFSTYLSFMILGMNDAGPGVSGHLLRKRRPYLSVTGFDSLCWYTQAHYIVND